MGTGFDNFSDTAHPTFTNLPEEVFDMDYPGHYLRRLKTVGLTIPCVAGPYTTVSCTLTLTRNSMRVKNTSSGAGTYPRKVVSGVPADDNQLSEIIRLPCGHKSRYPTKHR